MSKMFSVVTLDASHSLMTEHFVPGSPDGLDELLDCDEISEVLAEWPLGDTIEAKIQTYLYGDGETVRADEEDLAFFREHFDELDDNLEKILTGFSRLGSVERESLLPRFRAPPAL